MEKLILLIAVCSVLTTARNLESLSIKKDRGHKDAPVSNKIGDFYQKLSNIPTSNSLTGKIDNIQTALVILHGYLDTVKDSAGKGEDIAEVNNDVDEAALQNVLNDIYRKIKSLYTTVENAGNSRVYKSLNSLYELLFWMYGEEFANFVREELPINDIDLQKEPNQVMQDGQAKNKNPNPMLAQLSDIDSMLKDINSNAELMLDEDRRNANFVNAMSRALHRIYSDKEVTTEVSETSKERESRTTTQEQTSKTDLSQSDFEEKILGKQIK